MQMIRDARIAKTHRLHDGRNHFLADLRKDLCKLAREAKQQGKQAVARLNGTSDFPWHAWRYPVSNKRILDTHHRIQFVEYTKSTRLYNRWLAGSSTLPANLHLTYSWSGTNEKQCRQVLASGGTVAVPFLESVPEYFMGALVIDGDAHDIRTLDKPGSVVGLIAKGMAKRVPGFAVMGYEDQP
jgi:hypothetical protein